MKKLTYLLLILFTSINLFSQIENEESIPLRKVKYYNDFLTFLDENGKTRLDVFIQVPYEEVNFIKTGNGFEAAYTVTVSLYNIESEKLITEKIWNEKVIALSFDQTIAPENYNLGFRSFNVPPGTYKIKTSVFDKESKGEFGSENVFSVRDLTNLPSISDIMYISNKKLVENSNKIVPNITKNISTQADGIPMFFEAYTDSADQFNFEFLITANEKEVVSKTEYRRSLKSGNNQVFYTLDSVALNLGVFLLTVNMMDDDKNLVNTTQKYFISRWEGVPNSVYDLDKAVDQLVYIANPDELDYINDAETIEEKTSRFVEFWKKKDPNPKNEKNQAFEEYYRRVAYANENFSNYTEGWRSDRGMVLIILGAPDNIDRHPFEYDAKPYEVWQYYDLNEGFVFVDNTGFGDYRLATPLYGDLFRYRY